MRMPVTLAESIAEMRMFEDQAVGFVAHREDPFGGFGTRPTMVEDRQPPTKTSAGKADADKARTDLLFSLLPNALEGVACVLGYGDHKYNGQDGRDLDDGYRRYIAAMIRHLIAVNRGEVNDPESGMPHWWHIASNAMFALEIHKKEHE